MTFISTQTFPPRPSPKATIPYSLAALRQDLDRLRNAWEDVQASRDRNAIYGYLTAVYGLVAWWTAEGHEIDRARRALRTRLLKVSEREDPFAAVIRCTAALPKPTSEPGANGLGPCATLPPTSPILSRWINSSNASAASTPVLLGSPGGWGGELSVEWDGSQRPRAGS